METFARVFPLDWTALQYALAIFGALAVVLGLLAFLGHRAKRKDRDLSRMAAERIAIASAGKMAGSQEDGDRFSLKESNSIKSLIADAVLALNAGNTKPSRRALANLKTGNIAPALAIFSETAAAKRIEAERAAREAGSALRHQGALVLPDDAHAALRFFQHAFDLDPDNPENLLALALVQFRLGNIPSVEALIERARAGDGEAGREDIAALIDMFAGVLHLRGGRFAEATERFGGAGRVFEEHGNPKSQIDA